MSSPVHLDATAWLLAVCIGSFLAATHAYRKLSPYFAIAWFGSGLVFGWSWTASHSAPEAWLLPALVTYLAAAVTKGLVETGRFSGNHVVHVLATGVFTGVVALPLEAAARAMGWTVPREAPRVLPSNWSGPWLGGVPADVVLQWMVVGAAFYGVYKLLDHIGVGAALQTVLLFAAMPFLPRGIEAALRAMA